MAVEHQPQLNTPVVFIIFNRPDLTRRVFAAIRQAQPKKLLVIADGPRDNLLGEAERCEKTRAIVEEGVDWDCEVIRNYSDVNLGMRERFSSGFKWIFENVDEVIILEDDCLPHPTFFPYCEELLAYYRDNPRIMWIGGTNPLAQKYGDGSYFFSRWNWVWGWATWKRAWQYYDINVSQLPQFKISKQIEKISPYKRFQEGYMALFEMVGGGSFNNWDAQSTFTIWEKDGLSIIPNVNLVSNIGFRQEDPLANLKVEAFGMMLHPTNMQVHPEHDLYLFDTYQHCAKKLLRNRKMQALIPFYKPLRAFYRWVKPG